MKINFLLYKRILLFLGPFASIKEKFELIICVDFQNCRDLSMNGFEHLPDRVFVNLTKLRTL